jgi:transcriptional regulator with XRE-family HTH domain
MKQVDLARLAGVSRTYISQIETGTVDAVMTDVAVNLAKALNVSVAYLLGQTDAPAGTADDGAPVEASGSHLTFEVRDPELRALLVEIADLVHGMTPAQRRYFADQTRLMRRLMDEEESRARNPIIIG